jgi:hypothetical protein
MKTNSARGRMLRRATAATAIALSLVMVISADPASASQQNAAPVPDDVTSLPSSVSRLSYDPNIAAVQKDIAEQGGGEVLGSTTVPYSAEVGTPGTRADATGSGAPSGCSLTVTVYITYRTKSRSSVYNESTTYCPGAKTYMELTIVKEDTIFGTTRTVADKSFLGGGDFSAEVPYFCPTGNISGFQGRTFSEITIGGQEYKASAYDGTEGGGFYRYNCG